MTAGHARLNVGGLVLAVLVEGRKGLLEDLNELDLLCRE